MPSVLAPSSMYTVYHRTQINIVFSGLLALTISSKMCSCFLGERKLVMQYANHNNILVVESTEWCCSAAIKSNLAGTRNHNSGSVL